jgi:hypothetical protein
VVVFIVNIIGIMTGERECHPPVLDTSGRSVLEEAAKPLMPETLDAAGGV